MKLRVPHELKKEWDRRIGIPDIEANNRGSTFPLPSEDGRHGIEFVHFSEISSGVLDHTARDPRFNCSAWESDGYVRSITIERAIGRLKDGAGKWILTQMHELGPSHSSVMPMFSSWKTASNYWVRFCESIGVNPSRDRARTFREKELPAPVRSLSQTEISKLNYKSPKELP